MAASLSIRPGTIRAVGRLVFGLAWFLGCGGLARAQALPDPSMPAASAPIPATAPGFAAMPLQPANLLGIPVTAPCSSPTTLPPVQQPRVEMGLFDTIIESLFGDAYPEPSTWTPQTLGTFFTEGWLQPWVGGPPSDGGAPRQGWINSFDGVFYRLWFASFTYNNDWHGNGVNADRDPRIDAEAYLTGSSILYPAYPANATALFMYPAAAGPQGALLDA